MISTSITPSIGVTIGRQTRLYYAYITTAPAALDAPSTMTLYASTLADVSGYAGNIGVSTVREACNRNELRHVRIGGNQRGPIRTRKEWIDEWLHRWSRGGDGV